MIKKHFNKYYLSTEKVLRVIENQWPTNQISSIMPLDYST